MIFNGPIGGRAAAMCSMPGKRRQIGREVEGVRQEMAEPFAAMPPGEALLFKRRQRELEALHGEVEELLKGRRPSDRMNDLLLSCPIDLDREPQRRSRFYGLDELNRVLAEPVEDERRPLPPEPGRQGFGRGR